MRSTDGSLGGWSEKGVWRCREKEVKLSVKGIAGELEGGTADDVSKLYLKVVRSGAVALRKEGIGQPTQSGAAFIAVISFSEETADWL